MIRVGRALDRETLRAALEGPVQCSLEAEAVAAVEASRAAVDALLRGDRAVYGVNTGFGKLASERIAAADLEQLQLNLVRSHCAGVGAPLAPNLVRLIVLLKLASLARGASGVRLDVVVQLRDLLIHDLLPVIPSRGSVGASGDLAPLAALSLALIGEGECWVDGERRPGLEALGGVGLEPLVLQAKEGLALLNGTQVSTALALDGLFRARRTFAAAVVAGALSLDAIKGSDTPFDARIHAVRPHAGQRCVARAVSHLMEGSEIRASHLDCSHVQDPYSFRCQPQVMGAVLDLLTQIEGTLVLEANSVSDNPLIFVGEGSEGTEGSMPEALSGGNFHAQPVAFAADILAMAICEIGSLSERRLAVMVDPALSELPPFLAEAAGLHSGFMIAQVTAAALVSENKQRSYPASVDSIPTSANQEDHVSMATHGALRLAQMNDNLELVVATELLAAAEGIDQRRPLRTSEPLELAHQRIRSCAGPHAEDRTFTADITAVAAAIRRGVFDDLAPELDGSSAGETAADE